MADVGFVFTTVFLVSYGFVKTVLLDFSPSTAIFAKAKFGKRKFFLRHPVGTEAYFSFGCFYTLKTRSKYAKYVIWPKYHFRVAKRVAKVIFLRFRGVIRFIKVVSVFRFGHQKCQFWYPQNRQKCVILAMWMYQK